MGRLTNLVYYACVAKGATILAEFTDGTSDLAWAAGQCLEQVPSLHTRFTYSTKRRVFSCLIEGVFKYCAIVDEALGKVKAFAFLERVRDEFKLLLHAQGQKPNGEGLEAYCLADDFATVFHHLVVPLVGVPQKEVERLEELLVQQNGDYDDDDTYIEPALVEITASDHNLTRMPIANRNQQSVEQQGVPDRRFGLAPLSPGKGKGGKQKVKDQVAEVKDIMMENSERALNKGQKLQVMVEGGDTAESGHATPKGTGIRNGGQQFAHGMWWRNVKLVLILDLVACTVLFGIWLGICRGFRCVTKG